MISVVVECEYCSKNYLKDIGHYKENIKLKRRFYCSGKCLSLARKVEINLICSNARCNRHFKKSCREIKRGLIHYCSRKCALEILNEKNRKKVNKCYMCSANCTGRRKYCSQKCMLLNKTKYTSEIIIKEIKCFYKQEKRIPYKKELGALYSASRRFYGSWNKAIVACGLTPNPVLFSKQWVARDGHLCDSLAEKIIDDYLTKNDIKHETNYPYPEGKYTSDFKVGNYFIEYFGLKGKLKSYDRNYLKKIKILKKYHIPFIKIEKQEFLNTKFLDKIIKDQSFLL